MGTEIVFVLIYPVAAACLAAAVFFWFKIASSVAEPTRAYLPLAIGYCISIFGLTVLSYVNGDATFTDLIQQGYYTEAERSLYLPRRVFGSAILSLVFALPAISFIVVPLTVRLIRQGRLTLKWIALYALVSWLLLSLLGLLLSARTMADPFGLTFMLGHAATPVIIYGLPIPLVALLFLDRR
jgi:hypothetical protein